MKKIIVDYDPASKNLLTPDGAYVGIWPDASGHPPEAASEISVSKLCNLKEAGFSADEIVELKKGNII